MIMQNNSMVPPLFMQVLRKCLMLPIYVTKRFSIYINKVSDFYFLRLFSEIMTETRLLLEGFVFFHSLHTNAGILFYGGNPQKFSFSSQHTRFEIFIKSVNF